jgi:hypothetical protein
MKGPLLGLMLILIGIVTKPLVLVYAIRGKYPWWMITPDDLPRKFAPHFGHYEETVRKIYKRFGRYIGDVYWLAFRNSNYGLAYHFKPDRFKAITDYSRFSHQIEYKRWGVLYRCEGYELRQIDLLWRFEILLGWQVRGAVLRPYSPRDEINMEFRPMFSIRKAG